MSWTKQKPDPNWFDILKLKPKQITTVKAVVQKLRSSVSAETKH
jgi:hypothetical protein